ncbi:MAG: hypothetical protein ACE5FD_07760 [Anaerolineae bacterium]
MCENDILTIPIKPLLLPELSRQFSAIMDEEGVTLADLLDGLAEEREAIYQERYGNIIGMAVDEL